MKWYTLILGLLLFSCSAEVENNEVFEEDQQESPDSDIDEVTANPNINHETVHINDTIDACTFIGQDLCGQQHGPPTRFLSMDTLEKYGPGHPYHIEKTIVSDSIHFSYEIISDCCYLPAAAIQLKNDSLIVFPRFQGSEPCDCSCDYSFQYRFPLSGFEKYVDRIGVGY